jgi:hypothetical protein
MRIKICGLTSKNARHYQNHTHSFPWHTYEKKKNFSHWQPTAFAKQSFFFHLQTTTNKQKMQMCIICFAKHQTAHPGNWLETCCILPLFSLSLSLSMLLQLLLKTCIHSKHKYLKITFICHSQRSVHSKTASNNKKNKLLKFSAKQNRKLLFSCLKREASIN